MAHFAKLDLNNIVTEVLVVDNSVLLNLDGTESELKGKEFLNNLFGPATWVQTSYNNNFRKQYAGIGYAYNEPNDVFTIPQPFPSWSLNENFDWQPPTPKPTDRKVYEWNEDQLQWDIIIDVPYPDDGQAYNWNEETQTWDLITE